MAWSAAAAPMGRENPRSAPAWLEAHRQGSGRLGSDDDLDARLSQSLHKSDSRSSRAAAEVQRRERLEVSCGDKCSPDWVDWRDHKNDRGCNVVARGPGRPARCQNGHTNDVTDQMCTTREVGKCSSRAEQSPPAHSIPQHVSDPHSRIERRQNQRFGPFTRDPKLLENLAVRPTPANV